MRPAVTLALFSLVAAHLIQAQSPPTFEAVIVRPSSPKSEFQSKLTRSAFIATRHTLQMLIQSSYPDLPPWRITGGPPWAATETWDLIAKLPAAAPDDQEHLYRLAEQMLRTVLAEEFSLESHFVKKEQPVYYLVAAKDGPKFKPSEGGEATFRLTRGGIEVHHMTMEEFSSSLYCPGCSRERSDRFGIR